MVRKRRRGGAGEQGQKVANCNGSKSTGISKGLARRTSGSVEFVVRSRRPSALAALAMAQSQSVGLSVPCPVRYQNVSLQRTTYRPARTTPADLASTPSSPPPPLRPPSSSRIVEICNPPLALPPSNHLFTLSPSHSLQQQQLRTLLSRFYWIPSTLSTGGIEGEGRAGWREGRRQQQTTLCRGNQARVRCQTGHDGGHKGGAHVGVLAGGDAVGLRAGDAMSRRA